ncbi:hypothetical protein CLAIMM_09654 [Cladophialophora immunda]|nr:hypothetical protein CLAIMM_09654 [Cladophialophora immunda]
MAGDPKDGILQKQKITFFNVAVLVALGLGSIGQGYSAAIIGTTLGQPSFIEYFHLDTREDATDLISTMNGIFQAGGVIGTISLPWVADRFGRKWGCAVPAILILVSGAILAGSVNVGMFIAFRFFSGAGCWSTLAAVSVMMNEITPVHIRGAMVDINAVMYVLGYVFACWVGFGCYFWTTGGSNTWRPPIAIQCFWPLCLLTALPFLPESPRWLCMMGRDAEAERTLLKLHADPKDPSNTVAKAEYYQIRKQLEIDRTLGQSWAYIAKKPSYRKRALLALLTTAITQASGALVINNYGPSLYRNLGYSTVKQLVLPAAWITCALGLNILAMALVDRFPRPKYMAFGLFGCAACLAVEAALVAEFVPSDNQSALEAAVSMLFVFIFFYELFVNGTQWTYLGEIFPTHIRAKGVCLGVANVALMNLIWLQSAPVAFANVGWRFYLAFIVPCLLGAAVMWIWFPDTKGLPLEEVATIFGDSDEVAVYQRDLEVEFNTQTITYSYPGSDHKGNE